MASEQSVEHFKGKARLPVFAVPKRYDIHLKPDLVSCRFAGAVRVSVDVVADTRFLVLNAADLSVKESSVLFKSMASSSKELHPLDITVVEVDEILVVQFDEVLPHGVGILEISFEGILNDQMKGFYRSTYEHNGEKKNMAVTQFEPTDARRCFPCWDEPAFKATFKMTLDVPSELVALSNMPVVEEKLDGFVKTVTFQESPIMSTYLVAVVVGLFDYVEAFSPDGTKVRVYCQVGKTSQGTFALDVAVKTLDVYKKYFAVPYSLPKLDMIAIPDFAAGAMENYGLVTYRETALLYDEHHSAAANKQRVAVVVAHELAHQWFGNLVTMEWWTHLWLNEGFATWVSYLAVDSLFPEWKIWTQFLDDFTLGLRLDALAESHPIEVDVNHASEIDEIFDAISYRKGASLIRMLQTYLGAACFQKSLASYIKRFSCSNAKTEDLWNVLEEESGEPVKMLMDSWTKQKGYPVIDVNVKENNLEFEQTQFLSSGSLGDGQWIVPVTLCCGSYSAKKKFLLNTKSEKLDMGELKSLSNGESNLLGRGNQEQGGRFWIKFNVDQTGFYRVKYDEVLATGLRHAIEANQLSETDRFGILDDSYALCMSGKLTLSSLLSLMAAYREELDYTVLSLVITIISKIVNVAADAVPEMIDDIKQFFINLLQYSAEKLGWDAREGEGHLDMMLRAELLTALAQLGHDITKEEALKRFEVFLNDRSTLLLPPDTRKAAYLAVMQTVNNTDKSGYESLLRVYRETDLSQEKGRILSCLASCPDPIVVRDALNFFLSPEVRSQDVIFGLSGVSRQGRDVAWIWLKENWHHITKTWGSGFLLGRFVSSVVSPFCSAEKAKEVEEFFASRLTPSISRTYKQSIERLGINAKWVESIKGERHLGEMVQELAHRKY
ncbi:aminopeptidase M1-like [Iris pallida]|uniref:Aminopeptidase n=1 Tax=Iris pallida TaxID=29817 RepID=A0AAX6DQ61_IRIPA|nr:aminopeptidase M1-like [Iris pallida]